MLLDSNIIIYAAQPQYESLRNWMGETDRSISLISQVEVLGYHNLSVSEKMFFDGFFDNFRTLPIDEAIIEKATKLRQQKKMSLGDSIIAATAIEFGLALATANSKDFGWIEGLEIFDPTQL